MVSLQEEVHF